MLDQGWELGKDGGWYQSGGAGIMEQRPVRESGIPYSLDAVNTTECERTASPSLLLDLDFLFGMLKW